MLLRFFFFNDTATTEIYTLSLHDALPIYKEVPGMSLRDSDSCKALRFLYFAEDRKSTRLNSSHSSISYAVFCLKKKKRFLVYLHLSRCRKRADSDPLSNYRRLLHTGRLVV